jgi:WXG100 family type VII secretion target
MADEIRLVYQSAEDMSAAFKEGAEKLQDVSQEMQNLASTLEDGALKGTGGEAFVDAIRSKLAPSLARFIAKFNELDGDVQKAVAAMRQADQKSKQMLS